MVNPSAGEARAALERDGFVAFADPVITEADLDEVRALVAEVIRIAPAHPDHVHDLATGTTGTILEVVRATELVPALRHAAAFRRCRAIAGEVLGIAVAPYYDHVIEKPAGNEA